MIFAILDGLAAVRRILRRAGMKSTMRFPVQFPVRFGRHIFLSTAVAFVAAVALLAYSPRDARAQNLFVIAGMTRFGILNVTTGTYTPISTNTTYNGTTVYLYGLATAANGNLYALENTQNPLPRLFQVNRTSGALSLVGAVDFNGNGFGFTSLGNTSDGTLYAYHKPNGANTGIYTINPSSAGATLVGNGNSGLNFNGNGSINGDNNGNLFAAGGSADYRIDRTTGTATTLAANTGAAYPLFGLGFTNNALYGLDYNGGIYTINTTTGAATNTGVTYSARTIGSILGATSVTSLNTPEPATLHLLEMGLAGGAGMVKMARRRKRLTRRSNAF